MPERGSQVAWTLHAAILKPQFVREPAQIRFAQRRQMFRPRSDPGLHVAGVDPGIALGDARPPAKGQLVDLHDVPRSPVPQVLPLRVELGDGQRDGAAHTGQQSPHRAGLAPVAGPQLAVERRRLVAVGEKDEDGLRTQGPRDAQPRVHALGNLTARGPRHAPVHRAYRGGEIRKPRAYLDRRKHQKRPVAGEQAQPELRAAREGDRRVQHRRLGVLEPRPGVVAWHRVGDVHALGDVEHHQMPEHIGRQRQHRPAETDRRQHERRRQHREPGARTGNAVPECRSRAHGSPS